MTEGTDNVVCPAERQGSSARSDPRDAAAAADPDGLDLYDDPAVQSGFVRRDGQACEASLLVEGMHCPACALRAERTLAAKPGVSDVSVNFATHVATVRWDPARARLSELLGAVRAIGYRASPYDPSRTRAVGRSERRNALARICVAGLGSMQVMMYAVPAYLAGDGEMTADIASLMRWASLALTLPVVLYSAFPFFAGAWRDLRGARLGMDVSVSLGIAVAFVASVDATFRSKGEVYFDSLTMFVFLLLIGRYLELLARARAARALGHLGRVVPEFAARLRDFPRSLDAERVAVARLRTGEIVLVRPGETFPADGIVVQGTGSVSEALVSGESRPVEKGPGSAVIAGSGNLGNPLVARVTRVGAETVLSSILRLAEKASAEKPRLIRLADRTASWFVASVVLLAAIAGYFWTLSDPGRAIPTVVAVLVATCPCALSLSAPIALTVAVGEFARNGIVVAKGDAIETLALANELVFDKTGTLTRGEPILKEVSVLADVPRERCLAVAAALEASSEHPIGKALAAAGGGLRADSVRNCPGSGIEARVDGALYRIGTLEFATALRPDASARDAPGGDTVVWLGAESGLLASFALGDDVRPEAAQAVEALQALGVRVHLLSGDREAAVRDVARRLGIAIAESNASPERKREYVAGLQRRGRVVAMVGDGINDAPVLARADVSLAMGGGARLAQLRADAVIVTTDLSELARAVAHARRALRIVGQNIAWAFGYNVLVLPLALTGALTPWAAALGMSASSLIVALNALRLERARRPGTQAAVRLARV